MLYSVYYRLCGIIEWNDTENLNEALMMKRIKRIQRTMLRVRTAILFGNNYDFFFFFEVKRKAQKRDIQIYYAKKPQPIIRYFIVMKTHYRQR